MATTALYTPAFGGDQGFTVTPTGVGVPGAMARNKHGAHLVSRVPG